jgi:hypothetical protein
MSTIDIKARQINFMVVYYGTVLGVKTTNIRYIHAKSNPMLVGKLLSLET